MSSMSRGARAWSLGLGLCLLVPALGIARQDEAALETFHNRKLSAWPLHDVFRSDPVVYFRAARGWFSERVYPVQEATQLQKSLAFHLLHSAPEPRVTLGDSGHIFLNAGSNVRLHELIYSGCVHAHSPQTAAAVQSALAAWDQTAQQRHLAIDIVVVPTSASIYGDKLPSSVPDAYRQACLERTAGNSPLLSFSGSGAVRFVYPLRELLAMRMDPALFPRANWHPTGLSLQLVRTAYLARLRVPRVVDDALVLGELPSEILSSYGIEQLEPAYRLVNPHVGADDAFNARLKTEIAPLFRGDRFTTHAFTNTAPVLEQSALMISDSYGDLASETFAGAFRHLTHVNINDLQATPLTLVDRVARMQHVDRLILLIQEGSTWHLPLWNK